MAIDAKKLKQELRDYPKKLMQGKVRWEEFLDTASAMYKYRFRNQLAIHIQRPDATAAASMRKWNQMGLWIKRKCTAIRLAEKDRFNSEIFVFDIKDTRPGYYGNTEVKLWTLSQDDYIAVRDHIAETYDISDKGGTLENTLKEAAINAADELFLQLAETIQKQEELDERAVDEIALLFDYAQKSCQYLVLKRCGFQMDVSFSFEEFFGSKILLSYFPDFGDVISQSSGEILMGIEKMLREREKEREKASAAVLEEKAMSPEAKHEKEPERLTISETEKEKKQKPQKKSEKKQEKTKAEEELLQISFFQPETAELIPAEDMNSTVSFSLGEDDLQKILYDGNNKRAGKYRIYAQFKMGRNISQIAEYLKDEYRGGKGIYLHGNKYALWYSEEGIQYARGNRVIGSNLANTISWQQAAEEIEKMLKKGIYLSEEEQALAQKYIYDHTAEYTCLMARELEGAEKRKKYLPVLEEMHSTFPKGPDFVKEIFQDENRFSELLQQVKMLSDEFEVNPSVMRSRFHPPASILLMLSDLKDYMTSGITYPAGTGQVDELTHFLTDDEIDMELTGGSNIAGGKGRIYKFFAEERHDNQEKIAFLKKEFGIGGSSGPDLISKDYDGSGYTLSKKGCSKVKLSWHQVASKLDRLVKDGRLAASDMTHTADFTPQLLSDAYQDLKLQYPNKTIGVLSGNTWVFFGDDAKKLEKAMGSRVRTEEVSGCGSMDFAGCEGSWQYICDKMQEKGHDMLLARPDETGTAYEIVINPDIRNYIPIGFTIHEDDTPFIIEKVDYLFNSVSLLDGSGAIPISRVEHVDTVRRWVKRELEENPEIMLHEGKVVYLQKEEQITSASELDRAKKLLNQYSYNEFDQPADFTDLKKVAVASAELERGGSEIDGLPIQVYVNLVDYQLVRYLGERLLDVFQYNSLSELIDAELTFMQFDDLISITDEELSAYFAEVSDKEHPIEEVTEKTPDITNTGSSESRFETDFLETLKDYIITDYDLGSGTKAEKYAANVLAIKTLHALEKESRAASEDEQRILSRYVGWGGLPEAFADGSAWSDELKGLLSEEEYSLARGSVQNAHYTQPLIIERMYDILSNLGYSKGKILEPSMGIGNFFGMMPQPMRKETELYGVELDNISGRIAKALYPGAEITIRGYEETTFRDNYFDAAIGNVPFGDYSVNDKRYNHHGFKIHDYFFAKTLDKVRAGGIVCFITSKGTLDKKSDSVRKYISHRAELLGAIRLPNCAFKKNAGTEVTSDILVLQKKAVPGIADEELSWLHLGRNEDGILMNQYFIDHPEMIIGSMKEVSGRFGPETACILENEEELDERLREAAAHIKGNIRQQVFFDEYDDTSETLPAEEDMPEYSYSIINGKLYYREGAVMIPANLGEAAEERARGMITIRDAVRSLIFMQLENTEDDEIKESQERLDALYEAFRKKHGLISARANALAFRDDAGYPLICSLENVDEDGKLISKADIFTKRTVRRAEAVTSVNTAAEALAVSLDQKGCVDLSYMAGLTGKEKAELTAELSGIIFALPTIDGSEDTAYVTADEYLSGNVRVKLTEAKFAANQNPMFQVNADALEQVIPAWLDASQIDVRIGSIWVPADIYEEFMFELFETPRYVRKNMDVIYNEYTGSWTIEGKSLHSWGSLIRTTYGTEHATAYRIFENSLNMKSVQITETYEEDGKTKTRVNQEETAKAYQKQDLIKERFSEWIWQDYDRRRRLEEIYNIRFNSNVTREYDGSHLSFPAMNPAISLRPHQRRAVARQIYGGNTLLAHAVGAGKTYEMAAAIMEKKRLGLCSKAMLVVPNHLTGQWAKEFMTLYPTANILAVTKKDFTPSNRKKFCSRIATGNYDAVIIGHSQFEMIPLSKMRQKEFIQSQIDDIQSELIALKAEQNQSFTVKQLVAMEKRLKVKLEKLNEGNAKDSTITFEELGIDFLAVDEAHGYKNLALNTKMRNVAGISTTGANKSYDMFAKCRYIDEITGGKGITFATGTPVSNSMTELYTMQKYLQYEELKSMGLLSFDAWASTYGETVTAWELAPEGTKYRQRTRFAKFFNLPELMSMFKNVADIQTADMLKLDVPDAAKETVVVKPTMTQLETIREIGERADLIHDGNVDPTEDNMLKVTTDGRKLALDERILTGEYAHPEGKTKVDYCVENCLRIYHDTMDRKSAQLIFCDLSTPKDDGSFNVYDEVKNALMAGGVPEKEIAFIHDANTEAKKDELYAMVRQGKVRFLMGSTHKMGAGMNVQTRLIALHHLDVPWRPADLEQQEGRIIRQGNENETVFIYRYVTENTFDAYSWQTLEIKQKFISQIMTSKNPARSCEDIDDTAMDYAVVKVACTGDGRIKEKMELENDVKQLQMMKSTYESDKYSLQEKLYRKLPEELKTAGEKKLQLEKDTQIYHSYQEAPFSLQISGINFSDPSAAGEAIFNLSAKYKDSETWVKVGEYKGFTISVNFYDSRYRIRLQNEGSYILERGAEPSLIPEKMENALREVPSQYAETKNYEQQLLLEMDRIKLQLEKPFRYEEELKEKEKRLQILKEELEQDSKEKKESSSEREKPKHLVYLADEHYISLYVYSEKTQVMVFDFDFEEKGNQWIDNQDMIPATIAEEVCEIYGFDMDTLESLSIEEYESNMQRVLSEKETEREKEAMLHVISEDEID